MEVTLPAYAMQASIFLMGEVQHLDLISIVQINSKQRIMLPDSVLDVIEG
jgi:hypothetical protein